MQGKRTIEEKRTNYRNGTKLERFSPEDGG